jgi:hypothetical protein
MSAANLVERMRAKSRLVGVEKAKALVELLSQEEVQRYFSTEEEAVATGIRVRKLYQAENGCRPRIEWRKLRVPHAPKPIVMRVNVYEPSDLDLIRRAL